MANAIIENQKRFLEGLDNPELGLQVQDPAGAPPEPQAQVVPGQEPPPAPGDGAAPALPPPSGAEPPPIPPQPASDETATLKQQVAALAGQVEHFRSLYDTRQAGMIAPLQRKVSELERLNQDLTRRIQENSAQAPPQAPNAQAPQAPAPAQEPIDPDDPKLKEFMDLYGDMLPGLQALINKAIQPALQQVKPAVEYVERQTQANDLSNHLASLYAKHPQAGNIIRTPQFVNWVERQPSYAKQAIVDKLTNPGLYPVDELISIYDAYQGSQAVATPPPAPPAPPSPGEMVVDVRRVPTSATPGGRPEPQPLTRERLTFINRCLTVDRGNYTPEQLASLRQELDAGETASNSAGFGLAPRLDTLSR